MNGLFGNMLTDTEGRSAFEYGNEIIEHLAQVVENLDAVRSREEHAYMLRSAQADASGNATVEFPALNGWEYAVERIATICAGAAAAVLIYLDSPDAANMIETVPNSLNPQAFADGVPGTLFVPNGSRLLCVFSGLTANTTAIVRLQVKRKLTHNVDTIAGQF